MRSVAVIPARGGSKGIKDKNIKCIQGKPLIAYAIEALKKSKVDDIYVSTDSRSIASIAGQYGAAIIERPIKLAQDDSTSEEALRHAIDYFESDILVFIQATSPAILPEDINQCIDAIASKHFDSAFTGYLEDWHGSWSINVSGVCIPGYKIGKRPRRQDINPIIIENGACYAIKTKIFAETNCRLGGYVKFVEMPKSRSFEIDGTDDLLIADRMLRA